MTKPNGFGPVCREPGPAPGLLLMANAFLRYRGALTAKWKQQRTPDVRPAVGPGNRSNLFKPALEMIRAIEAIGKRQ